MVPISTASAVCKTVLLLALLSPALSVQTYAWWVTAQFEAAETVIESIPVRELDRRSR